MHCGLSFIFFLQIYQNYDNTSMMYGRYTSILIYFSIQTNLFQNPEILPPKG